MLAIADDTVYRTGWYARDGAAVWTSFPLTGETYGLSADWLSGTATASLPDFGPGEHYVIVYSCSYSDGWNCHGNTANPSGYWQLLRPRNPDGSLPDITFGKLVEGSDLIDAGMAVGLPYEGAAPDIGAFEYEG